MSTFKFPLFGLTAFGVLWAMSVAHAGTLLASSADDFSTNQGQYGWSYGYYNGDDFQEHQSPKAQKYDANNPNLQTDKATTNPSANLLNPQDSPEWEVRRWKSNFNGTVNISAKFDISGSDNADFEKKILVDGVDVLAELDGSSNGDGEYKFNVDVKVGSVIDFALAPDYKNWDGDFNLKADISVPSGLVFTRSP